MEQREKDNSDGGDGEGAAILDKYPKVNRDVGRTKEQDHINKREGVGNLDNKRDEIRQSKWKERGIEPPKEER
ncbi:hypothetical protein [Fulvimonas soli]|jgi:hypothetical protein|uniref:hypothetical protein n=1 Tax=Fulvimonas soli TaxID=155197 RepID=UPI00111FC1B7|nr:hypothetical protein [Fulvimonas soli]